VPDDDLRPNVTGCLWILLVVGTLVLASLAVSLFTTFSFTESLVLIVGGTLVLGFWLGYDSLFKWTFAGYVSGRSESEKPSKDH
jgi:hypothetical protein